jgi:hypothetical protein
MTRRIIQIIVLIGVVGMNGVCNAGGSSSSTYQECVNKCKAQFGGDWKGALGCPKDCS